MLDSLIFLVIAASSALDVPLSLHLDWKGWAPQDRPLSVVFEARSVQGDDKRTLDPGAPTLPPGQWFIKAECPSCWSDPVLVVVNEPQTEASLALERATVLRARVKLIPDAAPPNRELTIHFQPTDGSRTARVATCPVQDGILSCSIPSGLHDLVVRADGYASHFRWNTEVVGAEVDLGAISLRRGSTFSGRVESAEKLPKNTRITVTLRPVSSAPQNDTVRNRAAIGHLVTYPNARGLFAFDVVPGEYRVRASAGKLASEERSVTIHDGQESVLRSPLRLEQPRTVTIVARPALNPWLKPWEIAISRVDEHGAVLAKRTAATDGNGFATFPDLISGDYMLEVTAAASTWHSSHLGVERDETIPIDVPVTVVRGKVTQGARPVPSAILKFHGNDTHARVILRTALDGTFAGYVPPSSQWARVEIEANKPRVNRTISDLSPTRDANGDEWLSIDLPENGIDGIVVDERGAPVRNVIVNLVGTSGSLQQVESPDGRFQLAAVEPGRYSLTAASRGLETAHATEVEVTADAVEQITLKLKTAARVRGVVRSAYGVATGTAVFPIRTGDIPPTVMRLGVDPAGRFDIPLAPGTRDVTMAVNAPGFAFRMLRFTLGAEDVEVAVDQQGGRLAVDAAKGSEFLVLTHNDAALPAGLVAYFAGGPVLENSTERLRFEVPLAEEGSYSICKTANQCVAGYLVRNGALTLRIP